MPGQYLKLDPDRPVRTIFNSLDAVQSEQLTASLNKSQININMTQYYVASPALRSGFHYRLCTSSLLNFRSCHYLNYECIESNGRIKN